MASNRHHSASPSPPTASAAATGCLESHSTFETPTKPDQQCAPAHGFCASGDASTCDVCSVTASARNHAIDDQNRWDLFLKEYDENCSSPGVRSPDLQPEETDSTDDGLTEAERRRKEAEKNHAAFLEAKRRLFAKVDAQKKRL